MGLREQIYKDYRRYRVGGASPLATIFLTQGFWATCLHRITRHIYINIKLNIIRKPLLYLSVVLGKFSEIITGIDIPVECDIGEGLRISHFGPIIFPVGGRIGRNCSVSHGVTLGLAGQGEDRGTPVLGDRVYLGPLAIAVGKITIGDDVLICPGAVVLRSVPPRAVVMGNPARVVSYEGSFELIKYDGMDSDPDRIASLSRQTLDGVERSPVAGGAANLIGNDRRMASE